jgi:hypothetical protein
MCIPVVGHGVSIAKVVVNETMELSIGDQGGDMKCKLPCDIQSVSDLLLGGPVPVKSGTDLTDQLLHGEMLEFKGDWHAKRISGPACEEGCDVPSLRIARCKVANTNLSNYKVVMPASLRVGEGLEFSM